MTPSGDVMRVTDTDLKWFNHFYTFEVQGKKCYQSIPTIAKVMGRARSGAQERIDKLESLGLLTVGKETLRMAGAIRTPVRQLMSSFLA